MRLSLTDLPIEPPAPAGTVVADIEYRADDQYLEIDFSNRAGQPGALISFKIVNGTLVAEIQYGVGVGKPNESIQLLPSI